MNKKKAVKKEEREEYIVLSDAASLARLDQIDQKTFLEWTAELYDNPLTPLEGTGTSILEPPSGASGLN